MPAIRPPFLNRLTRDIGPKVLQALSILWAEPARHLYRDRRRRVRRRRALARLAALACAVLLVVLLARLITRPRPKPSPQPVAPTPTPTFAATVTPEPAPSPTPELPEITAEPEPPPVETGMTIDSRAALIDLYWQMIQSGTATSRLEALSLPEEDLHAVTDLFSNYIESFTYDLDTPLLYVDFKPGVRALQAIEQGDLDSLSSRDRAIADQAVAVVRKLIRDDMTDLQRELAIHDYIADNCRYLPESAGSDTNSARGFFENGRCQCAGYVDTFRLLARLAGLEVEMIGGPTTRDLPDSKGHAWNLIRLDGLWYVVDVTWDDMSNEGSAREYPYFNLPQAAFGDSRSWDQAVSPAGEYARTVDEKYYYGTAEYIARSVDEGVKLAVAQLDAGGTAWLCFPDQDLAQAVCAGLVDHYKARGSCESLGDDLRFGLYRFALNGKSTT